MVIIPSQPSCMFEDTSFDVGITYLPVYTLGLKVTRLHALVHYNTKLQVWIFEHDYHPYQLHVR